MIKIIVTMILLLVTISYGKPPIIPDTKKLDAQIKAKDVLPPLRLKIKGGDVGIVYIVFKKIDSTRMLIADYSSGVPAGGTATIALEYDRDDIGYAVRILDPRTTPFKLYPLKTKHIVNGEKLQDLADAFYLSKKAYEVVHHAMKVEFGAKYSMSFEYEAEKKAITEETPFSLRIDMSPNLIKSKVVLEQDAELVKGPNPQMIQMKPIPFVESTVFLAGKDYRFTPLSENDTLVFDDWIKKCDGVEEPYYISYEAGFLFPDRMFGKHDYQLVDLATLAGTVVSEPMKGNEYYDAFKPLIGQFYYYDELKITVDGGYNQPLRNECK